MEALKLYLFYKKKLKIKFFGFFFGEEKSEILGHFSKKNK